MQDILWITSFILHHSLSYDHSNSSLCLADRIALRRVISYSARRKWLAFAFLFWVEHVGFRSWTMDQFWRGWHLLMFGALDIGMGVIGSVVFLVLGEWLSRIETKNESSV